VNAASDRPACVREEGWVHEMAAPRVPSAIEPLQALTSSQIAVGRAGTRFPTELYLRTREGHADARDAVHSEVAGAWAAENGCLSLQTQCRERHEYLLYPNHGRRLDDASKQKLASGVRGADVQIIVGDGLSPNAITKNGKETLQALNAALGQAGFKLGTPLFVKFARIGVADEIGVALGARATIILVGERPGLGTGDSLSIYIAVNPRLEQDNAEKNCISNVRPIGIRPDEAAALATTIIMLGFERGGGGVALGYGFSRR
jgi:ethanolamine ammonia-lyase small subunit